MKLDLLKWELLQMFATKEQIQEIADTLGDLDVWNYRTSKKILLDAIEKHRLYNKRLGETPESVLEAYIKWEEDQERDHYYYSRLGI